MRLRGLAAFGVLLVPAIAAAQQNSIQLTAAAHSLYGEPARIGSQPALEPDLGVTWLRPGTRFGMFQMEIRGTTRDDRPHVGRAFVSLRDLKHRGVTYTFEAGDSFFSTTRGEYQLKNLFTPAVNFAGVSARASTPRTTLAIMAGRATATRNIFAADTDTLDQGLIIARGSRQMSERLQITAGASRIRTRDLKEFTFTIADSDQGGGGARFVLSPAVHLVGDASALTYRRRDSLETQTDGSVLAGASVLLARGWLQMNASRFSPGELPTLAQPLADRQTWYAAGEYDVFRRIRFFGGWESFRANLDQRAEAHRSPTGGSRSFGGVRVPFGGRSSAALRIEQGDRRSRLVGASLTRVSDTGVMSAEWQTTLGAVSAFARFARRDNVEADYEEGSYTQNEGSGLAFVNLTKNVQLFSSVTATRNATRDGGGYTFWQFGGGTQSRVLDRGLWFRTEGLVSRNLDLASDRTIPQRTFSLGLNGEIAPNTVLSLNVYADRPITGSNDALDSWLVRTSVRVTRTFATGSSRSPTSVLGPMARHGGTGSIEGLVYADWNANGLQERGESPLENIPVRLVSLGNMVTSRAGEFAFLNVPIGLLQVGIDISTLPVDFDAPQVPQVQVELRRGETERLAFGLVPLGAIAGRVLRDVNGNGVADGDDSPTDEAVLVLDDGARSALARGGRFRFDAVRSGAHVVKLLPESLPEGSTIVGSTSVSLTIGPDAPAPETVFLISVHQRPEIRRVFPAEWDHPTAADARPRVAASPSRLVDSLPMPGNPRVSSEGASAPTGPPQFAIQIAALADSSRAASLVDELRGAGLAAYLVEPSPMTPDALYRVRIGFFEDRSAAEKEAQALEKLLGMKLWVVRER